MGNLLQFIHAVYEALRAGHLPELGFYTYVVLALLVLLEGPIATLLGAAAASAGLMHWWGVFAAASIGNLSADYLWYRLGVAGRIEWLFRIGRLFGVSRQNLERSKNLMREHAPKVLFLAKLTLTFMVPSLIAAGLVRAPWRRWFPAVFTGEMIWTGSLVLIGYHATEAIKHAQRSLEYFIAIGSLVFLVATIIVGRRILQKEE